MASKCSDICWIDDISLQIQLVLHASVLSLAHAEGIPFAEQAKCMLMT